MFEQIARFLEVYTNRTMLPPKPYPMGGAQPLDASTERRRLHRPVTISHQSAFCHKPSDLHSAFCHKPGRTKQQYWNRQKRFETLCSTLIDTIADSIPVRHIPRLKYSSFLKPGRAEMPPVRVKRIGAVAR
jgi:hypothetical protein